MNEAIYLASTLTSLVSLPNQRSGARGYPRKDVSTSGPEVRFRYAARAFGHIERTACAYPYS